MDASVQIPDNSPGFTITRVFSATREVVYKVWTDPEYVSQWWGGAGSTIVACRLDVRPGGSFQIEMRAPGGTIYVNRGVYLDVIKNERIVYRDVRDPHVPPGLIPAGVHATTFEDADSSTLVTITSTFSSTDDRDLMVRFGILNGIGQSLDRLERLLAVPDARLLINKKAETK